MIRCCREAYIWHPVLGLWGVFFYTCGYALRYRTERSQIANATGYGSVANAAVNTAMPRNDEPARSRVVFSYRRAWHAPLSETGRIPPL
jgi:hypothetical protein